MTYNETYRAVHMKDKNVAGFLALFFGWLGFHRFYLGQIGLGIVYCLLIGTGISFILGLIDAVSFFIMEKDNFDLKYNRKYYDRLRDRRDTDFDRRRRSDTDYDRGARARNRREQERRTRRMDRRRTPSSPPTTRPTRRSRSVKRANPYKQTGKEKYKEFDYQGAIADFEKSLEIEPNDPAVHFNLACAYSLEEDVQKSLFNLQQAVANGFKDEKRIREHEALAFVRIQPEFEAFVQNNYRVPAEKPAPKTTEKEEEEDLLSTQPDLLDQIKKLGELRDKGLLTEQEFAEQKKKLLG